MAKSWMPKLDGAAMTRLVDKLRSELAARQDGDPGFVPFATDELQLIEALVRKHHLMQVGRRAKAKRRRAA